MVAYLGQACDHDALVSRLSISEERAASGSHDCSVRLWDVATLTSVSVWRDHRAEVLDLAFNPRESGLLASCGADQACLLWDSRVNVSKGAAAVLASPRLDGCARGASIGAHSLTWLDGNENLLVLGDAAGRLHLVDRRQASRGWLGSVSLHQSRVSRLRACQEMVASISDDLSVGMAAVADFDTGGGQQTTNTAEALRVASLIGECHSDLPHGLCWMDSPATATTSAKLHFLSCGLEPRLLCHSFASPKPMNPSVELHTHEVAVDLNNLPQIHL